MEDSCLNYGVNKKVRIVCGSGIKTVYFRYDFSIKFYVLRFDELDKSSC